MKNTFLFFVFIAFAMFSFAQGPVLEATNALRNDSFQHAQCGHAHLHQVCADHHLNYSETSNKMMVNLKKIIAKAKQEKAASTIYRIPVVFHILYNTDDENLADEVILDQMEILNACFRRTNEDANEVRAEFLDIVGDTQIEFYLADTDPNGEDTNGILHVPTDIEYFGGVLPYDASQAAEIAEWGSSELYDNYFRITQSASGGSDAWDTETYMNVFIGDLRIFEPQINNFEELFFFGLATPPLAQPNWPEELAELFQDFNQGVLLHYITVGSNNPNSFPSPYGAFNNTIKEGKVLVHEAGHYLGLRHIWGDGPCSAEDFIDDTPNANAQSNFNCSMTANTCVDDINGADLPNMIENYMDYSDNTCQNSFTNGQAELMRAVLEEYRPLLFDIIANTQESENSLEVNVYPNPFDEILNLQLSRWDFSGKLTMTDMSGKVVYERIINKEANVVISPNLESGMYFIQLQDGAGRVVLVERLVK